MEGEILNAVGPLLCVGIVLLGFFGVLALLGAIRSWAGGDNDGYSPDYSYGYRSDHRYEKDRSYGKWYYQAPNDQFYSRANAGYGMPKGSWWKDLGVQEGASYSEVRRAYHNLAKRHHPDVGGDREKFMKVQSAWEEFQKGSVR